MYQMMLQPGKISQRPEHHLKVSLHTGQALMRALGTTGVERVLLEQLHEEHHKKQLRRRRAQDARKEQERLGHVIRQQPKKVQRKLEGLETAHEEQNAAVDDEEELGEFPID